MTLRCGLGHRTNFHTSRVSYISTLPYINTLSNPVILHSLHIAEPSENNFIPFVTSHDSPIRAFGTSSILLTPSKPLRLSIYTAVILDLSSFPLITSLPYIRAGKSNDPCKTLVHLICKLLPLTRNLIAHATLLPLTTFLRHSVSSVPDSYRKHPKYLNSITWSYSIPSTQTSHSTPSSPQLALTCIDFQLSSPTHLNKTSRHCSCLPPIRHTHNQVICILEARQSSLSPSS